MSLRTTDEIEKAVKEAYDKELNLRTRMEADFGKWRLTPYDRGTDYKSVTINKPRTLADLIIDFLVRAKRQIRIPIDKELEAERDEMSNAERFLIGILKMNDLRLGALVQPSLLEQIAWHSVVRGWYVLRAFITKDKNGATKPFVDVWDRLHTQYDIGAEGLLWVCHTRMVTASQIKAEYNVDIKTKKGQIYDFWDEEINSIHIKGVSEFLKSEEHGLDHIPCRIVTSGATPYIESETYQDTVKDVGESWLAANRDLNEPMNELASDLLTIVARGAKVPLKYEYDSTKGGKPQLDESPFKLDKDQVALVPLDVGKGDKIEPLIEPTMPKDAAAIMNIFGVMWQEGGVPESVYGQMPFQMSGYAISRLQEAIGKALGNAQSAIEKGGDWLLRELLLQFSKDGFKPIKVEGRDSRDSYFQAELKPEDVKGDWFPEYRLVPRLPEDEMERFAMARIAREGPEPIMSAQSTLDRILKVQDPDLEQDLKLEEWGLSLPPVKLRRLAAVFIERGRLDLAQEVMDLLRQPQEKQPPKSEAVQPEFQTGVPPSVMPPEALGRPPQGTPPPMGAERIEEMREAGVI